jgi:predicted RNA-binding Zn-ribbon protein involved in translation (DUF1610 family)
MSDNDKIERLKKFECPHCGHVGPPMIAGYVTSPNRAVCTECGKTVRTFITPVDILLVVMAIVIIAVYLINAP